MKVSIICPTYNEERYIKQCISSILAQDYPKEDVEVLFVDGMSTDKTRSIITQYMGQYSFIRLLDNTFRIVPYAMNIGITQAQGDIIVRMDAHARYATNYISTLVHYITTLPDAVNVGAPCKTLCLSDTPKSQAIAIVLSSRFGVGGSDFRIGIDKVKQTDTVPFGCWKKESFTKYGMFDTRLVRNQDIEMNRRIAARGGHIYIVPETYSIYYARDTYQTLSKNNYQNGKWNILTIYYTNKLHSLSVRHFVPLCFVLSLIVPLLLCGVCPWILMVTGISLLIYLCVLGVISARIANVRKLKLGYVLWAFITVHLSYGWGSLIGLLSLPWIKKHDTKIYI